MNESPQKNSGKGRSFLVRLKEKMPFKKQEDEVRDDYVPGKWVQLRLLPIWFRIFLVLIILIVVAIIGLRIGYGVIGDGDSADVLKKETWTHILDIINGKE